uniref:Putative secreted protein n=1 Tax=Ixodes ricinus TaxID=34613 RepID=A0A6B0U8V0_IXORI
MQSRRSSPSMPLGSFSRLATYTMLSLQPSWAVTTRYLPQSLTVPPMRHLGSLGNSTQRTSSDCGVPTRW